METIKREKTTAAAERYTYFPSEIIIQIILRLPCKSLLRFRSVCKQWRAWIDDEGFVVNYNEQLHRSTNAPSYLLAMYRNTRRRSGCIHTELHLYNIGDDGRCSHAKSSFVSKRYQAILPSSCGLVCLHGENNRSIVVYNPMSGETITLPDFPEPYLMDGALNNVCHNLLGFGFDPQSNKYKVVQLVRDISTAGISGCYVLTVRRAELSSWRRIDAFVCYCDPFRMCINGHPHCVDGVLYWYVRRYDILAFDLNKERIRMIRSPPPVPKAQVAYTPYSKNPLVVLRGKLCYSTVVSQPDQNGLLQLHVSELKLYSGGNVEWAPLYRLELQPKSNIRQNPLYLPLGIRRDLILLMDYYNSALYSFDMKEKRWNHKGSGSKIVGHGKWRDDVIVYDEALVILN